MAKKKNNENNWRTSEHKKILYAVMDNSEEFIVFDVETSGLDASKERIIQLSGIKYFPEDGMLEETGKINLYIRPPFEISDKIIELTGISNEILSHERFEEEILDEITGFFGNEFTAAAYNSSFDIRFLTELYKRHSIPLKIKNNMDVLAMARDLVDPKDTANYKLGTIAALYGLDKDILFHNSMDDVTATARLLTVLYKEYRDKDAEEERIKQEAYDKPIVKVPVTITSMRYWEGFRGFSRIYVNTDAGTLFYDIRNKRWSEKDDGILDQIDMEKLQADAYEMAGAADETEFARYRAS